VNYDGFINCTSLYGILHSFTNNWTYCTVSNSDIAAKPVCVCVCVRSMLLLKVPTRTVFIYIMFSLMIPSKWITLYIGNSGKAVRAKHRSTLGILVKPFVDGPLNAHVVL